MPLELLLILEGWTNPSYVIMGNELPSFWSKTGVEYQLREEWTMSYYGINVSPDY